MSYESKRAAIIAYVQTQWAAGAFASTPIEFENIELIDQNAQTAPFITCEIEDLDAHASALGNLTTRHYAELSFHVHVKEGSGTKIVNQLADALKFMQYSLGVAGVTFRALRKLKGINFNGWEIFPVQVSFYYDE
jgi:hypothetical protein